MTLALNARRDLLAHPAQFIADLQAWLPDAPPDEVAGTRHDLVDLDGYVRRHNTERLVEARRAARVTEWHMAQRWPVNPNTANRTDDRPLLNTFNSGENAVLWQWIYAVGQCDLGWLLDPARTAKELTQRAVRRHVDTMSTAADRIDAMTATDSGRAELLPALGSWVDLGPHRLYCGDSTDPEFVAACDGASFAFADPPYGIGKAAWDDAFTWTHDWLVDAAPLVAVTPGVWNVSRFLRDTTMAYSWMLSAWLDNGMTLGRLGFGSWIPTVLFGELPDWLEKMQDFRRVSIGNHPGNAAHPSRKPARLLQWLIGSFTLPGDLIVDPFLGSGTSLLVADREGRACIGAEIDPAYCAAIATRYEAMRDAA